MTRNGSMTMGSKNCNFFEIMVQMFEFFFKPFSSKSPVSKN
jgi:hypothetical protein